MEPILNQSMVVKCKNCGHEFTGNFCSNCGQKADVQRIDWQYVYKEIRTHFISFDKSKLLTIKELFTRPGHSIREYLDGKRVNHYKPFSLVLLIASAYGLLYHFYNINFFSDPESTSTEFDRNTLVAFNEWVATHFSAVTVISIPLYSLGSYLMFRKQDYNFPEHLVLNSYLAAQRILVRIAVFPLLIAYNGTHELFIVSRFLVLADLILLVWGYHQFFNKLTFLRSLFYTLLAYMIYVVLLLTLLMIIFKILNLY